MKILLRTFTLFLILTLLITDLSAQIKQDPPAPYLRFPDCPPFTILLSDSSNHFTKEELPKKKPVLFMLFNPDCEHCQHETEELTKNIDRLKEVTIVMATTASLTEMKNFISTYQLEGFKNIIVGKDIKYMLPVFFNIHNYPFLAFYNKKKELISVFEGSMPIEKLIAETKK